MLNKFLSGIFFIGLLISACNETNKEANEVIPDTISSMSESIDSIVYSSDNLVIRKISPHVYEHTSYLQTASFGKVPCNGMVVVNDQEAIVFDTPADSISSVELIRYFTNDLKAEMKAILPTHFHTDCVGGLKEFHQHSIPSYANNHTIRILKEKKQVSAIPQNGFADSLELPVGALKVFAGFFGEGHTADNIVGYFPEENILFGGCLLKEIGAGKGNLEDANISAWPGTIQKVKKRFSNVSIVIPGHGKSGGAELLDYTNKLFSSGK